MATATSKPPRASYQDVLDAPEHMVAEVLDGELSLQPRPAKPHARACSHLGVVLGGPFDLGHGSGGPGGWHILDEPELHLGEDILVPDVAGWRRERLPELGDDAFFTLAPDWVCEVLSPSTQHNDRGRKLRIYAREQVRHVWLVDPLAKLLEVYLRVEPLGRWSLVGTWTDADTVEAPPFEALSWELAKLWG